LINFLLLAAKLQRALNMLKKSFKFLPLSMALFIGGSMVMTGCGESETKGGEVTDTEKDANDDPSTDMHAKIRWTVFQHTFTF
jgi:hypothetical protein